MEISHRSSDLAADAVAMCMTTRNALGDAMNPPKRASILGFPIDVVSIADTMERIASSVRNQRRLHIVTANVDFLMKARRSTGFYRVVQSADLIVPDGVPLLWAGRLLSCPLAGRVNGTDLVWSCVSLAQSMDLGVALVGAAAGVADAAAAVLRRSYPRARVFPIPTPLPLTRSASEQILATVRASGARILLVALGTPAGEQWIHDHLDHSGATVGIGVGSAFDIISGQRPRAPGWMQRAGLEWLHRLRLEPSRLARRYLVEDSPFTYVLFKEYLRHRSHSKTARTGAPTLETGHKKGSTS